MTRRRRVVQYTHLRSNTEKTTLREDRTTIRPILVLRDHELVVCGSRFPVTVRRARFPYASGIGVPPNILGFPYAFGSSPTLFGSSPPLSGVFPYAFRFRVFPLRFRVFPLRFRVFPLRFRVFPYPPSGFSPTLSGFSPTLSGFSPTLLGFPLRFRVFPLRFRVFPYAFGVFPYAFGVFPYAFGFSSTLSGFPLRFWVFPYAFRFSPTLSPNHELLFQVPGPPAAMARGLAKRLHMDTVAKVNRARAACLDAVSLRADAEILCRPEGPIALLVRTRQERARAERTAIDKAGDEYEAMLRNYGDGDDFTGSSVRTEPHEPPPRSHDACSPRRERRVRARRPRSEMAAACRLTRAAARCACSSSRIRDTRRRLLNAGRQRSCAFGQPA
jgi:hypothetical protein